MSSQEKENQCCPHCGGELKDNHCFEKPDFKFICRRCCRGWRVDSKGTWIALFDAGHATYDKKEAARMQKYWKKTGPKYPLPEEFE
jgi:hypothetical protein